MSESSRNEKDAEVRTLLDKGLVRFAIGQREEAVAFWRQALERSPRSSRARDYLLSVGAVSSAELSELGAASGEHAPVSTDLDAPTLERQPGESLVPPFTDELPSYSEESETPTPEDMEVEPVVPDVEILLGNAKTDEAAGELESALGYADEALRRAPDHPGAIELAADLRRRLADRYRKELEPLESVPFLRATDASILELSLDPIGGFLISQIDGEITVDELLTILGTFDEFRVLSSLHFFLENGIIELRS